MKKTIISTLIVGGLMLPAAAFACGCQGNAYRTSTGPVSPEEAQVITQRYLSTIDNGSFHPGEIKFNGNVYLAPILDENDNTVANMSIDALTGEIRPVF